MKYIAHSKVSDRFDYWSGIIEYRAAKWASEKFTWKPLSKDQMASLEWVRKYIAGFGGDLKRRTNFGDSASEGTSLIVLRPTDRDSYNLFLERTTAATPRSEKSFHFESENTFRQGPNALLRHQLSRFISRVPQIRD